MEESAAAIAILVASKLGAAEEDVTARANKAASLHSYNQPNPQDVLPLSSPPNKGHFVSRSIHQCGAKTRIEKNQFLFRLA